MADIIKCKMLWECEHCGKLIPYMYYFCNECADKLFGEAPKPFDPPEKGEKFKNCDECTKEIENEE